MDVAGSLGLGGELLDRYPHELSGGQQQRVAERGRSSAGLFCDVGGMMNSIFLAGEGLDEAGVGGGVVEGGADFGGDVSEAAFEIDVGFGAPNGMAEFLAGDDLVWLCKEKGEGAGGLGFEGNGEAVAKELVGGRIEGEEAEAYGHGYELAIACFPVRLARVNYFSAPSVWATPFFDSLMGESPRASLTPDLSRVVSPGPWKKA